MKRFGAAFAAALALGLATGQVVLTPEVSAAARRRWVAEVVVGAAIVAAIISCGRAWSLAIAAGALKYYRRAVAWDIARTRRFLPVQPVVKLVSTGVWRTSWPDGEVTFHVPDAGRYMEVMRSGSTSPTHTTPTNPPPLVAVPEGRNGRRRFRKAERRSLNA